MKRLITLLVITLAAMTVGAQEISTLYAAGVSFNNGGSPAIAGSGLFARKVADTGTYAFGVADAVPASVRPFTVTTSFGAGVAQKLVTIGRVPIFVPTSAGISYNGQNTGWAWSTGAMAGIRLKRKGVDTDFWLLPAVRVVKSSVGGSGYQPIVSVLFGFGK